MATPVDYSEFNCINSVAAYIAPKLLTAGYLIYWFKQDAVQTNAGWYPQWSTGKATYLLNSTFLAQWNTAKGLLTLVDAIPAVPRFVIRLIDDASVGPADQVPIPALSLELGPALPVRNYELGTTGKWRSRHLILDAYVRTEQEQGVFKDLFAVMFDNEQPVSIRDHSGSLIVLGDVNVADSRVDYMTIPQQAEATTYEVLLNARLLYVA